MSVGLDPIVAKRLSQFARRRRQLLIGRGLSAAVVSFVSLMAIVAAVDWYWVLTDTARWCLSGAAYLGVLGFVWLMSLRRLVDIPGQQEIATRVEQLEPELRENLVSAVELAADDPSSLHDSPVFRSLLQGRVAEQMGHVRVRSLLPIRLIAGWTVTALLVAGFCMALLTQGDPRIRQLATRAILPGANLDRVSRIQVTILQPTPHSMMIAEDETVAVLVEIGGGRVDQVTLETHTAQQGTVRHSMTARAAAEFVSNLHVADEPIEYRILAGDAITRRYTIDSRPRPRVTAFRKTYRYPDYAEQEPRTTTEAHGDLVALEGAVVEMQLALDQEVSEAEIRVEQADTDDYLVIPLTRQDEQTWTASVEIEESAIYKVHLVSRETGFANIFSPRYEIQPQPDLIPRVGFVDQQQSNLLLPPNDILNLAALAEDDLPLVSLEQLVSVNGQPWNAVALTSTADDQDGYRLTAAWNWDLVPLSLKAGDQVLTKLVAQDRKGNVGESLPLRVIVAASDFDPDRHETMQRKAAVFDRIAEFADLLHQQRETADPLIEAMLKAAGKPTEAVEFDRTAYLSTLTDLTQRQQAAAEELVERFEQAAREFPRGADSYELELAGRVVARLQRGDTNHAGHLMRTLKTQSEPKDEQKRLNELKQSFHRSDDDAQALKRQYQEFLTHNVLTAIALDLDAIHRQQSQVVNHPTQTFERLLRHETVVIRQLAELEELIRNHRQRLSKSMHDRVFPYVDWSAKQRERLQESMESEDKLPQLRSVAAALLRELAARQKIDVIDGGLPARLVNGRKDLDQRAGSLYAPIERLAWSTEQARKFAMQATESTDSQAAETALRESDRYAAEANDYHFQSLDQLRIRRRLMQARPDSDAQYAADAGLTHRAVTSLLLTHASMAPHESEVPQHLAQIAPAYRILEAGHELKQLEMCLDYVSTLERWGALGIQSHLDHPRQWDVVANGLELAARRLREARVPTDLTSRIDRIRWARSTQDAAQKITSRRYRRQEIFAAQHELAEVRTEVRQVVDELQPIMAEARSVIAAFAPSIPELARQASDQLRELQEQTLAVADEVEQIDQLNDQKPVDQLEQRQEDVNQQIEDLFEALVEDANAQDLLDEQQRERAQDADDSIALIQPPAVEMNAALEDAAFSEDGRQQAEQLAQAAEKQHETAEALEQVAEHFEQLEQGLDVAESRAALRQNEPVAASDTQPEDRPAATAELTELAGLNAAELMAELEAELQRNPAMREALSEISRNAIEQARNSLEFSEERSQQLRQALERSDPKFLQQKRELAQKLRELANDSTQLSNSLVAQANQSADRGKAPQAKQKLTETQQQLNAAAGKARTANENQLLEELVQTLDQTKQALKTASENLNAAKKQTAQARNEKIHPDEKSRQAQKKQQEEARKAFYEQQKRAARDQSKRADDVKRRADQQVRNAENQAKSAERQVASAQRNLKRKPDNAGLKRTLAQAEARHADARRKAEAAKEVQKQAQQQSEAAKQKMNEVNQKKLPPLDAPNPAGQLADDYTAEAQDVAQELNNRASELAQAIDWADQLNPAQNQLADATNQAEAVKQDVDQAGQDVARAARHEQRLNKESLSEPLQKSAADIRDVSADEAAAAEAKLGEAQQQAAADQGRAADNQKAISALSALSESQAAIGAEADSLSAILEPIAAAAAAQAQAAAEGQAPNQAAPPAAAGATPPADGAPASNPGTNPPGPGEQAASPVAPSTAAGESQQGGTEPASAAGAPAQTPDEIARGQQLARTLDELDQLQAQAASATGQTESPSAASLPSLAQAAQAAQAQQRAARAQATQNAVSGTEANSLVSSGQPALTGDLGDDFSLTAVNRRDNGDWGQLREKSSEDVSRGRMEGISPEFRKGIETYFRVIAERARSKK